MDDFQGSSPCCTEEPVTTSSPAGIPVLARKGVAPGCGSWMWEVNGLQLLAGLADTAVGDTSKAQQGLVICTAECRLARSHFVPPDPRNSGQAACWLGTASGSSSGAPYALSFPWLSEKSPSSHFCLHDVEVSFLKCTGEGYPHHWPQWPI